VVFSGILVTLINSKWKNRSWCPYLRNRVDLEESGDSGSDAVLDPPDRPFGAAYGGGAVAEEVPVPGKSLVFDDGLSWRVVVLTQVFVQVEFVKHVGVKGQTVGVVDVGVFLFFFALLVRLDDGVVLELGVALPDVLEERLWEDGAAGVFTHWRGLAAGERVAADVAFVVVAVGQAGGALVLDERDGDGVFLLGERRRRPVQVAAGARVQRITRRHLPTRHHRTVVEEVRGGAFGGGVAVRDHLRRVDADADARGHVAYHVLVGVDADLDDMAALRAVAVHLVGVRAVHVRGGGGYRCRGGWRGPTGLRR
jgi:hypothetical protein